MADRRDADRGSDRPLVRGLEERDQKRLTVNQEALRFARDPLVTERFWADPPNTVNEIEASYPRHAFCASLRYLLAEVSRADLRSSVTSGVSGGMSGGVSGSVRGSGGADRSATLNSARSAVDEEITRIADEAGMPVCYLRELATATAEAAVPWSEEMSRGFGASSTWLEPPELCRDVVPAGHCAAIRARTHWLYRQLVPRECLLVLDAYGENACVVESGLRRQRIVEAQQRNEKRRLEEQAPTYRMPSVVPESPNSPDGPQPSGDAPTAAAQPETGAEDPPEEPVIMAAPAASAAPNGPGDCGGAPPAVFTQHLAGVEEIAEAVAEGLTGAGWPMRPLDAVQSVPKDGEMRYYYPDQEGCARTLADDVAAVLREAGLALDGLSVISLAGTYRNLPRGRMELWLPAPPA